MRTFRNILFIIFCICCAGCATSSGNKPKATCRVNDPDISGYYIGQCMAGIANGNGMSKGRDEYHGEFKNGYKHGQGRYIWGTNSAWSGHVFVGEFVNDDHVKGVYTTSNEVLEGTFTNSKLNGLGTIRHKNGTVEEGTFKDDALHGFGTIKNATSIIKQGLFSNGKLKTSCKDPVSCQAEVEALEKLLTSGQPEEVYLTGVKFETESDFEQAKLYYNNVITRFTKTPIAMKAADRLLAINDKIEIQKKDADAKVQQYLNELNSELNQIQQRSQNKQLCEAQRQSCYASCKKNDYSCSSRCGSISCY